MALPVHDDVPPADLNLDELIQLLQVFKDENGGDFGVILPTGVGSHSRRFNAVHLSRDGAHIVLGPPKDVDDAEEVYRYNKWTDQVERYSPPPKVEGSWHNVP